jgi:single-strand DNA-binding protein
MRTSDFVSATQSGRICGRDQLSPALERMPPQVSGFVDAAVTPGSAGRNREALVLDNMLTVVGNLTDDPQFTITSTGVSVCTLRLACTHRVFDREFSRWRDGESSFFTVVAWRQLAENVNTSLRKGDRVAVVGRIRQRPYEHEGVRRVREEIEADTVAADLTWACVQVRRNRRPAEAGATSDTSTGGMAGQSEVRSAAAVPDDSAGSEQAPGPEASRELADSRTG